MPCETADISECSVYTIQPRTMSPNVKHTNSFRSNLTHTCDGCLPRDRRRGPLTKRYVHTHRWRAWRHGRSPWLHAHSQAPGTNVTIGYTATRRLSSTNKPICHAELYKQTHLSRWALQTNPSVMLSSTNKATCHAELYKQSHLSRWALQTKPPVMLSSTNKATCHAELYKQSHLSCNRLAHPCSLLLTLWLSKLSGHVKSHMKIILFF